MISGCVMNTQTLWIFCVVVTSWCPCSAPCPLLTLLACLPELTVVILHASTITCQPRHCRHAQPATTAACTHSDTSQPLSLDVDLLNALAGSTSLLESETLSQYLTYSFCVHLSSESNRSIQWQRNNTNKDFQQRKTALTSGRTKS